MDKLKSEVGNKKHPVRKVFLIGTIALATLAVGIWALTAFSASPILMVIEGTIIGVAAATLIGCGVAANKIFDSTRIKQSKKVAGKSLEKIKQLNKDKSSTYTRNYRAKIIKRYANANLSLTKRQGASIFGTFHSNTGIRNEKATTLLNQIDSYTLLRDTATTKAKQKKYSKKLSLAEQKLSKIVEEEGVKTSMFKWTKSYDEALHGVSVLDRRTEIVCLSQQARDDFKALFENTYEITDNKSLNIVMHFNQASSLRPAIAKVEDQTKAEEVKRILLNDVVTACNSKTPLEIRSMFPIALETKLINKQTTKILKNSTITVHTLSELKELASTNNSVEKVS